MFEIMSWSSAGGTDDTEPSCSCGCACSCSCEKDWVRTMKGAGIASGGASADLSFNSTLSPTSPLNPFF